MTQLQQHREEFIEASCPTGAPQEQIQDMQMAFDAGSTILLHIILSYEGPIANFADYMDEIAEEILTTANFHTGN